MARLPRAAAAPAVPNSNFVGGEPGSPLLFFMQATTHSAYLEGIRLFNASHYWHAHEQWEQCWLRASGRDATFYKALIQAAAALVKLQQHNRRGFSANWAKSCSQLDQLPRQLYGLDLVDLRSQIEQIASGDSSLAPTIHLSLSQP